MITTIGRGRTVDEWQIREVGRENHWWDCMVGAAVAASIGGSALAALGEGKAVRRRERVKLSELQRLKKAARS